MSNTDTSILIVDDSKTDVAIIKSILEDYRLTVAYDGLEAMEITKGTPISVLFFWILTCP